MHLYRRVSSTNLLDKTRSLKDAFVLCWYAKPQTRNIETIVLNKNTL